MINDIAIKSMIRKQVKVNGRCPICGGELTEDYPPYEWDSPMTNYICFRCGYDYLDEIEKGEKDED